MGESRSMRVPSRSGRPHGSGRDDDVDAAVPRRRSSLRAENLSVGADVHEMCTGLAPGNNPRAGWRAYVP